MTYAVREIFYTLQGEGANIGRAVVSCRFTGCNLWSGREADRTTAVCRFCGTDFIDTDGTQGGKYTTADTLVDTVAAEWPANATGGEPLVICTGDEPLLQLNRPLIDALHARGFEIAIETNGTITMSEGIDWVYISPEMGSELIVTRGDELRVMVPQDGQGLGAYERLDLQHFFLQAMNGPLARQNTTTVIELCQRRPRWRLSLRARKVLGIR